MSSHLFHLLTFKRFLCGVNGKCIDYMSVHKNQKKAVKVADTQFIISLYITLCIFIRQ